MICFQKVMSMQLGIYEKMPSNTEDVHQTKEKSIWFKNKHLSTSITLRWLRQWGTPSFAEKSKKDLAKYIQNN